jgi:hypothetical protein
MMTEVTTFEALVKGRCAYLQNGRDDPGGRLEEPLFRSDILGVPRAFDLPGARKRLA